MNGKLRTSIVVAAALVSMNGQDFGHAYAYKPECVDIKSMSRTTCTNDLRIKNIRTKDGSIDIKMSDDNYDFTAWAGQKKLAVSLRGNEISVKLKGNSVITLEAKKKKDPKTAIDFSIFTIKR